MINLVPKGKLAKVTVAAAALAVSASSLLATPGTASADPQKATALVGVGSDTTQDVMNAMAGYNNGINYTPIQGNSASKFQELVSWDATPPSGTNGCITVKTGFGAFPRPNGSSSGQRALSRSIDGSSWGPTTNASYPCSEAAKPIGGQIDFARSSAVPTSGLSGTDILEYLPFAKDALSFGVYRKNGTPTTSLTKAQLVSLFTTGPQAINGVWTIPCGIQTGSGTDQVWKSAMNGVSDGTEASATAYCTALPGRLTSADGVTTSGSSTVTSATASFAAGDVGKPLSGAGIPSGTTITSVTNSTTAVLSANATATASNVVFTIGQTALTGTVSGGRLQESNGLGLKNKGDAADAALAGTANANPQVVVGFSVGNWIAQANGVAKDDRNGVQVGTVPDWDANPPYTGTSPNILPNQAFYAGPSSRLLYNVVSKAKLDGFGNDGLKSLFVNTASSGNNAAICQPVPQATVNKFGFDSLGDALCGLRGTTTGYRTGTF